jgi:AcrR family transcriptional regulator
MTNDKYLQNKEQRRDVKAARARTDPELVRARILEVAEEMFRRVGYQKTTVADIAAALGMSAANVYRFFPSKGAINEAICARLCEEMAGVTWRAARAGGSAAERLEQALVDLHRHAYATFLKEKRMHDMVAAALEENWPAIKANIERIATIYEGLIREGIESGEFAVDDPHAAAQAIKAGFASRVHPTMLEQCADEEDLEAHTRSLARFLIRALRPAKD